MPLLINIFKILLINCRRRYPKEVSDKKTIFIHIPRTAGSSISSLGIKEIYGHVTYNWYKKRDPNKFAEYFKFTFVRNPWDRLVSAYFFLKGGGSNSFDKLWYKKNISLYDSFDEFVCKWVNDKNVNSWIHFIPQYKFIFDKDANNQVDFIGKFERLEKDVHFICDKLRINESIPHFNKSSRGDYRTYYSTKTKEIVAYVYRDDIKKLGYEF